MDNAVVPNRKTRWSFIIGALVVGAGLFLICRLAIWYSGLDERARKLSRLSRDECQQVLAECRQLLANKATHGNAQYGTTTVKEAEWPAYIRSLSPDGVHIEDNRVRMVFGSGKHFCGLWAYADGISHSTSERDTYMHTLELTKGLWLWEDADGYEVLKWAK